MLNHAPPALDPDRHGLFLDIDGTVVDIAPRPQDVCGDESLRVSLRNLSARFNGALAVITGRSISDADRILGRSVRCVAGVHGLERRVDDVVVRSPTTTFDDDLCRKVFAIGAILDATVEQKDGGFAVHYRAAPQFGDLVRKACDELAARHKLRVIHGKMVAEILAPGPHKGDALATIMGAKPFAGRLPVAVGDDVTDEDAFQAASRLGGFAVLVGSQRPSAAAYRLESVAEVRRWLSVRPSV